MAVFSEVAPGSEVDRSPLGPDENHDGVIYLRIPEPSGGAHVKAKCGTSEMTLNWITKPNGKRELEPFVLLPFGAPTVVTSFKTLNLTAGAMKVSFFLAAAGVETQVAEKWVARAPLLACSLQGEINAKAHLNELDLLIGRKGSTGVWARKKETPPPLGWPNAVIDEQLTFQEFQSEVPKHEFLYLMAHGMVSDPVAIQDWGFRGVGLYDPAAKLTHLLLPSEIAAANQTNPSRYALVFLNSCAALDMSDNAPREYCEAFECDNYVSWDKPVLVADATNAAKKFFKQLDGGKTVSVAVQGIQGTMANPITHAILQTTYSQVASLGTYVDSDDIIIDQTP
jgi:hypothetical protein